MARYKIHHKDGTAFCDVVSIECNDKWSNERSVSVDVQSPIPLDFKIGDYIDYLGERYRIYDHVGVLKQARVRSVGDAFKYNGIVLKTCSEELKHCMFKNMTDADSSEYYYTSSSDFSLHCDDVRVLLDRIITNMNHRNKKHNDYTAIPENSQKEWRYDVLEHTESATNVDLQFQNITCWEALQMVITKFFCGVSIKEGSTYNTIIVGTTIGTSNKTLAYGKNNGLVTIERIFKDGASLVTRLRAYGSTKNLPTNYYSDVFEPIIDFHLYHQIGSPEYYNDTPDVIAFNPDAYDGFRCRVIGLLGRSQLQPKIDEQGLIDALKEPSNYEEEYMLVVRFGIQIPSRQSRICIYTNHNETKRWANMLNAYKTATDFAIKAKLGEFFYVGGAAKGDLKVSVTEGFPRIWILPYKKYWRTDRELAPIGLGINRLMLPDFLTWKRYLNPETGMRDVWLETDPCIDDADGIEKYGIREKCVMFDNDENGDIFPTIQGMRVERLRELGYTIDLPDLDNGRMDEILWCQFPNDNGYISNTDTGDDKNKPDWFHIYIKDLGFDMASYFSEDAPKIKMMSGDCSGREFEIIGGSAYPIKTTLYYKNIFEEITDEKGTRRILKGREFFDKEDGAVPEGFDRSCTAWKVRCKRESSGELAMYFPNNLDGNKITGKLVAQTRPGDKTEGELHSEQFVLLNIEMPTLYIEEAAQRLKIAAEEWLKNNNYHTSQYNVKLDPVFMQRDADANGENSLRYSLRAGTLFKFEDFDLDPLDEIKDEKWFIDTFNIKENGNGLPDYSITLKRELELSTIQKLNNSIVMLNVRTNALTSTIENTTDSMNRIAAPRATSIVDIKGGGVSESDVTNIGDKRYARLDEPNKFTAENEFTELRADGYFTKETQNAGIENAGAAMYDQDGSGHVYTDYLTIRRVAYFRELTIAEVNHIGGEVVLSPAACQISHYQKVTNVLDGKKMYRCFFEKEANGRVVYNEWKIGDHAYCKSWDSVEGQAKDVASHFYWRRVVDVHSAEGDEQYHYIDLSSDECAVGSQEPSVNDNVVLFGCDDKTSYRSCAQVYSTVGPNAPSRRYYYGITNFSLPEQPLETLEHDKDKGAVWRVGGIDNFIEYDGDLRIKAKSIELSTENGNVNVSEALGDNFKMWQTDMQAPMVENVFATQLYATAFDVSLAWDNLLSHIGDYIITSDGVTYKFVANVDDPSKPYWEICTDQYLLAALAEARMATTFIQGFRSKDGMASMYSGIKSINADGTITYKEGQAGTFVMATEKNGEKNYIVGFKIDTDVFICNAKNLSVDKEGNLECQNARIRGFIYRDELIITPENINDYLLDEDDWYFEANSGVAIPDGAYVLDIRKTGSKIVLKGIFQSPLTLMYIIVPSLLPSYNISKEQLAVLRSTVGETMLITNNAQHVNPQGEVVDTNIAIGCVNAKNSDGHYIAGPMKGGNVSFGKQASIICKRDFASVADNGVAVGDEIIYWERTRNDIDVKYHVAKDE